MHYQKTSWFTSIGSCLLLLLFVFAGCASPANETAAELQEEALHAEPPGEVEPAGEVEPVGEVEPAGEVEPIGEVEPVGEVEPADEVGH